MAQSGGFNFKFGANVYDQIEEANRMARAPAAAAPAPASPLTPPPTSFDQEVAKRAAQIRRGGVGVASRTVTTPPIDATKVVPISTAVNAPPPGAPPAPPPGATAPAGSPGLGSRAVAAGSRALGFLGRGAGAAGGLFALDDMAQNGPSVTNVIGTVGGLGSALAPAAAAAPIAVGSAALLGGMKLAEPIVGHIAKRAIQRNNMIGPETVKFIQEGKYNATPELIEQANIQMPVAPAAPVTPAVTDKTSAPPAPPAPAVAAATAPEMPNYTDPRAFGPIMQAMTGQGGGVAGPQAAIDRGQFNNARSQEALSGVYGGAAPIGSNVHGIDPNAYRTDTVRTLDRPDGSRLITNFGPREEAAPSGESVRRANYDGGGLGVPGLNNVQGRGLTGGFQAMAHLNAVRTARSDQLIREGRDAATKSAIAVQVLKNQAAEADRQKDIKLVGDNFKEFVFSPRNKTTTTFEGGAGVQRQVREGAPAFSQGAVRRLNQMYLERDPAASEDQRRRAIEAEYPGQTVDVKWLR